MMEKDNRKLINRHNYNLEKNANYQNSLLF